jgi:hypothetical protein
MTNKIFNTKEIVSADETPAEAMRGDLLMVSASLNGKELVPSIVFTCEREDFDSILTRGMLTLVNTAGTYMMVSGNEFDIGDLKVREVTMRKVYSEEGKFESYLPVSSRDFKLQQFIDIIAADPEIPEDAKRALSDGTYQEKAACVSSLFIVLWETSVSMTQKEKSDMDLRVNMAKAVGVQ